MRTRYLDIADDLRTRVQTLAADTQLPVEAALSEEYGCSLLTLRNALRVLQEEGLIRREQGRGTFVEPRRAKPQTSGLVLYWGLHEGHLYQTLFHELTRCLSNADCAALAWNPEETDPDTLAAGVAGHLALAPKAVFLLGHSPLQFEVLKRHETALPPVYNIFAKTRELGIPMTDVLVDFEQSGWLLGEHLANLKHERVLLYGQETPVGDTPPATLMVQGLHRFADHSGALEIVDFLYPRPGDSPPLHLQSLPERVALEGVSAIVTGMDFIAVQVIQVLQEAGLDVPGDVSVTGFGHTPWSEVNRPALTSVSFPLADLARTTVSLLLRDETKGTWLLPPTLHAGASTAPRTASIPSTTTT